MTTVINFIIILPRYAVLQVRVLIIHQLLHLFELVVLPLGGAEGHHSVGLVKNPKLLQEVLVVLPALLPHLPLYLQALLQHGRGFLHVVLHGHAKGRGLSSVA